MIHIKFPGFFDLQVNGFGGVDFNNPDTTEEDICRSIEKMRQTGVTRFLPTLITSSFEKFAKCATRLARMGHPAIAGIHMEGPYISPEDGARGAHPREYVTAASIDNFSHRQEAADGQIKLVTLAPEVAGVIPLITYLVNSGVRVAIGHTAASSGQIRAAEDAGATLSTHLGNGCAQQLPRHPNFIWDQLATDSLYASLIVDGFHLPPATVKAMVRAKTPKRIFLITDAVAAAGCAPGNYELNGESVVLDKEGRVFQPGKPWLTGSAITMNRAVANIVKYTGLSLEEVLPMASSEPARYLGVQPLGWVAADWSASNYELCNLKVSDA